MHSQEQILTADLVATPSSNIQFPNISQSQLARADISGGVLQWRIWLMLAYQDIKLRYRRSILGPFWLTLSMGITVYSMGYLYAHLFHVELAHYYPFLVAGMLSWSLISTMVIELTDGLVSSDGLIKQIKLPYSVYVHRIVARNVLIFFHNIVVIVPIMIIYHSSVKINLCTLMLIPGLLLIYLNAFIYGLVLSMIGARYRDISQIIKSLVQVVFFVTPVMWGPEILSDRNQFFIDLNPFYAFIELIRAPVLGTTPTMTNVIMAFCMTLLGAIGCWVLFKNYRARIVYWL